MELCDRRSSHSEIRYVAPGSLSPATETSSQLSIHSTTSNAQNNEGQADRDGTEHEKKDDIELKPIPVPDGYPRLDARPMTLQSTFLMILIIYNAACLGVLCFAYWKFGAQRRFTATDPNVRLAALYVPTIVGTITTVAGRSVTEALVRTYPYLVMADKGTGPEGIRHASGKRSVGSRFLPPLNINHGFYHFSVGDWTVSSVLVQQFMLGFVTGLKSVFLSISDAERGWTIVASTGSGITLITIYAVHTLTLIFLFFYLYKRTTGLKWDSTTIADQLALFYDSNVLPTFEKLEWDVRTPGSYLLRDDRYRLGYWRWQKGSESRIVYGIRAEGSSRDQSRSSCAPGSHKPFCNCPQTYLRPASPYYMNPIYGGHWWCIIWLTLITVAIGFCILAIVKGISKTGFSLQYGSGTLLPITVYAWAVRFPAVALSGILATGFIQMLDISVRFTQPFANMYRRDASVSDTLLLDYLWGMPGVVTITAIRNEHYKVAWFSVVSLAGPTFPVLVAGFFGTAVKENHIVFKGGETVFYAMFIFLIAFAGTILWELLRARKRYLPRMCTGISDLMSLFYASQIMYNPALDISDKGVEKRHLESRLFLQEERFETGLFTGVDGEKHFGVDMKWRDNNNREMGKHVTKVSRMERTSDGVLVHEEYEEA